MKKKYYRFISLYTIFIFVQSFISPFLVTQAQAKGQVVIEAQAGKPQIKVNGQSFTLKTGVQIKDGVHVIRLKKEVFSSIGINYSEWDEAGKIFVGLKYGWHQIILEIQHGRREINVKADGQNISITPAPTLEGPHVFVPLEPLYELLGFFVEGAPATIVQKPQLEKTETPFAPPTLLLESATIPKTSLKLPASGKVKKYPQNEKIAITIDKGAGTKLGEVLYITRNSQLVGKVKVMQTGAGWCVANILFVEKGRSIKPGDMISAKKPEVTKLPEPEKKKPFEVTTVPTQKVKKKKQKKEVMPEKKKEEIPTTKENPTVIEEEKITEVPELFWAESFPSMTNQSEVTLKGVARGYESSISSVEYKFEDDLLWSTATPADGAFDSFLEEFKIHRYFLADGEHKILVKALNKAGNETQEGTFLAKTFTIDTKKPMIIVVTPAAGVPVKQKKVVVSGKAEYSSTLKINGTQVAVNEKGEFTMEIELKDGSSTVVLEAVDKAGNVTKEEWTVTVAAGKNGKGGFGGSKLLLGVLGVGALAALAGGGGKGGDGGAAVCGNGACESGESASSCPSDCSDTEAQAKIDSGWSNFSAGNYNAASIDFISALNTSGISTQKQTQAYNGLGWSYAKTSDYNSALTSFQTAKQKDANYAPALAGEAAILVSQGASYSTAITSANKALTNYDSYSTELSQAGVSKSDLYLTLALSYLATGDYQKSCSNVQEAEKQGASSSSVSTIKQNLANLSSPCN